MENSGSAIKLRYHVEDRPQVGETILLGFQNVITSFGGLVAVPILIGSMANSSIEEIAYLISAALFVSGLVSIIQSKGFGPRWFRVGAGLPTIMGTDFAFIGPAASVIALGGIPAYFGGSMLASLLEIVMSYFVKPLMKYFPPVVTGSVITLLGATLMSAAMDWVAGGAGAEDYGSPLNLLIAVGVFLLVVLINHYAPSKFSSYAVLIGMAIGYLVCIPLDMVDLAKVGEAAWISLPSFNKIGIDFNPSYAIPFLSGYLVTVIETVGVMQTLGQVTQTELTDDQVAAGVRADGFGSFIAPLFGSGPAATFSQNAGLIPLTRNASRIVALVAGLIMILLSMSPKLATIISVMPLPILGGAGILMFGTVAAAGIQSLSRVEFNTRSLIIIASSVGVGLGVSFRPEITSQLPSFLAGLFSSGISAGTIVALLLNLILKDQQTID